MAAELGPLIESFGRACRARNLSLKTEASYLGTAQLFLDHLHATGRPPTTAAVTRASVETFIGDQLARWKPSTAASRYRYLQQFVKFLIEEDELDANPMAHTRPPAVDEHPVPVLSDDELRRLVEAADGKSFLERRNAAIVRVFIDTGVRTEEMASMVLDELDLKAQAAYVVGKGRRGRWVPLGAKSVLALDRYLRRRREHPRAGLPALWLGPKGPLTASGIYQMIDGLAEIAGIEDMHPHRFRHTLAHRWLAEGGQEGDLQQLAGWRSAQMLARYGASAKAERARDAHRRLGLGDAI